MGGGLRAIAQLLEDALRVKVVRHELVRKLALLKVPDDDPWRVGRICAYEPRAVGR